VTTSIGRGFLRLNELSKNMIKDRKRENIFDIPSTYNFTGSKLKRNSSTHPLTPYWNVAVDKNIIPDHNKIFGSRVQEFVRIIVGLVTHEWMLPKNMRNADPFNIRYPSNAERDKMVQNFKKEIDCSEEIKRLNKMLADLKQSLELYKEGYNKNQNELNQCSTDNRSLKARLINVQKTRNQCLTEKESIRIDITNLNNQIKYNDEYNSCSTPPQLDHLYQA
jgi:hypothetical protein